MGSFPFAMPGGGPCYPGHAAVPSRRRIQAWCNHLLTSNAVPSIFINRSGHAPLTTLNGLRTVLCLKGPGQTGSSNAPSTRASSSATARFRRPTTRSSGCCGPQGATDDLGLVRSATGARGHAGLRAAPDERIKRLEVPCVAFRAGNAEQEPEQLLFPLFDRRNGLHALV